MSAYYNEHDRFAAEWLRQLIKAGLIADGEVDERDIRDVRPEELAGFAQCHFFAGIGVWSYALRRAGFRDDQKVWTGSCPCQPFSASGKRAGFADERHLWPAFFHLIRVRRPSICFGEQVSSSDGETWLELVQADMEGAGYRFAPLDLCSAGFGASDIRGRFYWVADADGEQELSAATSRLHAELSERGASRRMDYAARERGQRLPAEGAVQVADLARGSEGCGLVNAEHDGRNPQNANAAESRGYWQGIRLPDRAGVRGFWSGADWVLCNDPDGPKWRPVEPGTFPLVTGATNRVGRLRGYGNALNAEVAKAFIEAYRQVISEFPEEPVTDEITPGVSDARDNQGD